MIHRNKNSKLITSVVYNSFYLIVFLIRRVCTQHMINFHGGAESSALVYVQCNKALISFLYLCCLFFKWKEQIFFQSPFQKSSHLSCICHFQNCQMSHSQLRLIRRRDQTVR